MEDGSLRVLLMTTGTTQGDPFGPVNHNFTIDELLKTVGALVDCALLYYLDDGTIVGPVEELARFLDMLTDPDGPHNFKRLTGMEFNIDKCSIWTLGTAFPADDRPLHSDFIYSDDLAWLEEERRQECDTRRHPDADLQRARAEAERARLCLDAGLQRARADAERAQLCRLFPARTHGMRGLRAPRGRPAPADDAAAAAEFAEDALASQGVVVLGSPVVGTTAFVQSKLTATLDAARAYVAKVKEVLYPVASGASATGECFPDEYLALMRTTLPGRFQHHLGAVTHRAIVRAAEEFDAIQLDAYTHAVGTLHSDHLQAREFVQLSTTFGGRGYRSMVRLRHDHLLGTWGATHAILRRRFGAIRRLPTCTADLVDAMNDAEYPGGAIGDPLPSLHVPGPLHAFVLPETQAWAGIVPNTDATLATTGLHLDHAFGVGLRHTVLDAARHTIRAWDRVVQPLFFPLIEANRPLTHLREAVPREIPHLDVFTHETARNLTRHLAAVSHAADFMRIYTAATPAGRAALLEQATEGAVDWLSARPRDPAETAPIHTRYAAPSSVVTHHQATLLLPLTTVSLGCSGCGDPAAYLDPRHIASCPCGIRASDTLHHPVRDLLVAMLSSVYGHRRVLREGGHGDEWELYSVVKRPDVVVRDAFGPGANLVIDVKTLDATGRTQIATNHTDELALGGHVEVARGLEHEYTDRGRLTLAHAIGAESRLVCVAVGRFGGLGGGLLDLISKCALTRANAVGAHDLTDQGSNFYGMWRHRFSLLVATATSARIHLNATAPAFAAANCAARRADAAARRAARIYADVTGQGPVDRDADGRCSDCSDVDDGGGHASDGGDDRCSVPGSPPADGCSDASDDDGAAGHDGDDDDDDDDDAGGAVAPQLARAFLDRLGAPRRAAAAADAGDVGAAAGVDDRLPIAASDPSTPTYGRPAHDQGTEADPLPCAPPRAAMEAASDHPSDEIDPDRSDGADDDATLCGSVRDAPAPADLDAHADPPPRTPSRASVEAASNLPSDGSYDPDHLDDAEVPDPDQPDDTVGDDTPCGSVRDAQAPADQPRPSAGAITPPPLSQGGASLPVSAGSQEPGRRSGRDRGAEPASYREARAYTRASQNQTGARSRSRSRDDSRWVPRPPGGRSVPLIDVFNVDTDVFTEEDDDEDGRAPPP